jgi:putative endonuclease
MENDRKYERGKKDLITSKIRHDFILSQIRRQKSHSVWALLVIASEAKQSPEIVTASRKHSGFLRKTVKERLPHSARNDRPRRDCHGLCHRNDGKKYHVFSMSLQRAIATWQSRGNITSMESQYYVYIMTNKGNTVLYTGVTHDLKRRIYEHKEKLVEGFTKRYNVTKLVYYEIIRDAQNAIMREKQIKAGSRAKKIALVDGMNPTWNDLYDDL